MLTVHRAESGIALVDGLTTLLAAPSGDPFAADVVAVPAKGVERWLAQRLSHRLGTDGGDGVCANVLFPTPGDLLDGTAGEALPEHAAAVERWSPRRATLPLVEVIDDSVAEPWCAVLARHVGDDGQGRRVAVGRRLARLFDEYGASRPHMLVAWAAGRDVVDGDRPLPDDVAWQAHLWRRLRDRLGTPSPAELLDQACAAVEARPEAITLPGRVSVFGASRLSVAQLRVLVAVAAHRDVHLWLHHASPALWDAVARDREVVRRGDGVIPAQVRNPLLASLSRDVVELQRLLRRHAPAARDVHHPSEREAGTLLRRLQRDLAEDRVAGDPPAVSPTDHSVQVHACHGRMRQVEVLREVLLGLLADDPTLEPRDILVMCPDVEEFAPLIAAAFALGGAHPAAQLRVRVADRALRRTNPLLHVLSRLLELGVSRVTAAQILDLAGLPAVRRRFGFTDDELDRLRDWVAAAGVHWGLDGGHRGGWRLADVDYGTWRSGLDRILLGVTMEGDGEVFGGVLPLDDVDSADIDLAGRLAELVDRVAGAVAFMSERHPVAAWTAGLAEAVLALAAAAPRDAWQQLQLTGELADLAEAAAGSDVPLALADVRVLLEPALAGRPTQTSFRTGALTVCSLVPMRSVPHRVVCLLGLDDGTFPRQTTRDGDDILARDPWVGERDPRSEDRQLLLDAVCAAGEYLVVTYCGADDRTGVTVPPAVPLGEVLDAIDRAATAPPGRRVRDVVTVRHPLQPFDARNFTAGALGRPGPFSFDDLALAGAISAAAARRSPESFLPGPLAPLPPGDVDLADLHRLLRHPARGFLRQRLQVAATLAEQEPQDGLPVTVDALERWAIGERLLAERLSGLEPADCIDVELRRGLVPPGELGVALLREVGRDVEAVVTASAAERALAQDVIDVDVPLPGGGRLVGTVGGVRGDVVLSTTYSSLSARHRLQAWVDLVALTAARPGPPWTAVAVGRRRGGAARSVLGPIPPDEAAAAVAELVALYRSGLREPLPLPLKSGAAYAERRARGSRVTVARTAAAQSWVSGSFPGEQGDPEHALVHGADAPLSVLTGSPPGPQERGEGWPPDEDDRFGLLARRLWDRLLASERQEQA